MGNGRIDVRCLFVCIVLVYALFDEYALERGEKQLFSQLAETYLQFVAQYCQGSVYAVPQHVADTKEHRLIVAYYTAVGGYADLTIGESVKGVDGLVA